MSPIQHTFDTLAPGDEIDLGSRQVTEAEIIAFARDFDPQPFTSTPMRPRRRSWRDHRQRVAHVRA